jgi:predicted aconitase
MHLRDDELRMLDGREGELRQEAMKFLVRLGEVYHAEEMVDIGFAFCYVTNQTEGLSGLPRSIDTALLMKSVAEGVTVKVPTIGGLGGVDPDIWREMKIPEEEYKKYLHETEIECKLGIAPVATCTPYMVTDMNQVPFGTHMCTIESSAIPFYNSVLGARVERSGISSFFAALTGKYPAIGYHLDENRYAAVQIDVACELKTFTDFGALGLFAGELCGMDVPVFNGISKATMPDLIALSSAIATGGAVSLFHIPGITPEFSSVDAALHHRAPKRTAVFGQRELAEVYERFHGKEGEPVNTVLVGCPHYSLYQLRGVAEQLAGRHVAPEVSLIMSTAPQTKFMAEQMGYVETIRQAGGMLISRTCPIISAGCPGPVYSYTHPGYTTGTLVTDSLKVASYAMSTLSARKIILGDTRQCLEAALAGVWGGQK